MRSRVGWIAVLAGVGLAAIAQLGAPVRVPLYDGVSIQEPYRYLHPTGDQLGSPASYQAEPQLENGKSPTITAATTEIPPQAQLIALGDAFVIPPGTTAMRVSIQPIDTPTTATGQSVAGNAYRFSVTDQNGTPLAIRPCTGCISLALRGPEDTADGSIARYVDGTWAPVQTEHGGATALFQANPTALGDYAVIASGVSSGVDPFLIAVGVVVTLIGLGAALLVLVTWRRRRVLGSGPGPSGRAPSTRAPTSKNRPRSRRR